MLDGFLVVDKPSGITSHHVVAILRRTFGQKKIGHTGTLDPFATGVLPVALGEGTKAIPFLDESVKEYRATMRLGICTDTQDLEGEVLQEREWSHATALDWELLDQPDHKGIHDLLRDLNALYRARTSLHEGDCEPGGFSWIEAGDRANSVLSLLRLGPAPGDLTVVILNFTALVHRDYRVGVPVPGPFEECLNTDGPAYGGQGFLNPGSLRPEPIPLHGCRQSIRLTLPPLGAVFLRPTGGGVE